MRFLLDYFIDINLSTSSYMLPQQFLTMASQSIEVVASQFTDCQRLKRSIEVMRTLKAQ